MIRTTPYSAQEIQDMETIFYQFIEDSAYALSPGFDNIWIKIQVFDTKKDEPMPNIKEMLETHFYRDAWPKMILGLAKAKNDFYVNKELVVHWVWPERYAVRTYPAPDAILETLENNESVQWKNRVAYVHKPHVAPVYQMETRKKKSTLVIENPDDLMHRVEL